VGGSGSEEEGYGEGMMQGKIGLGDGMIPFHWMG
jgi:hypothetical protein